MAIPSSPAYFANLSCQYRHVHALLCSSVQGAGLAFVCLRLLALFLLLGLYPGKRFIAGADAGILMSSFRVVRLGFLLGGGRRVCLVFVVGGVG